MDVAGFFIEGAEDGAVPIRVERVVIKVSLQGTSLYTLQRDGYEPNDETRNREKPSLGPGQR